MLWGFSFWLQLLGKKKKKVLFSFTAVWEFWGAMGAWLTVGRKVAASSFIEKENAASWTFVQIW
jgi:hypothetical protein